MFLKSLPRVRYPEDSHIQLGRVAKVRQTAIKVSDGRPLRTEEGLGRRVLRGGVGVVARVRGGGEERKAGVVAIKEGVASPRPAGRSRPRRRRASRAAALLYLTGTKRNAHQHPAAVLHGAKRRHADDVPEMLADARLRRATQPEVLARK